MTARVFVHPRCHEGPASGSLAACLETRGFSTDGEVVGNLLIGPPDGKGHCELVKVIESMDDAIKFARMDGTEVIWQRPALSRA